MGVSMKVVRKFAAGGTVMVAAVMASIGMAQADGAAARKAAPVAAPTSWSGLYFGAQAGWSWSDVESDFVTAAGVPLGFNDSVHHDAGIVGGQIGIQHQFGHIVVGIEASSAFAYNDDYANVNCPNELRTCGKRLENVLSVGPRVGWAMGKWMPYLTGGYASAHYGHKSFDNGFPNVTNVRQFGDRFSGWYVGAGVDMALAQGWTVGLEYRHYDFDSETIETFLPTGIATGEFRNVEPTLDTVAVRVSWKLGRPEPAKPMK